jgi:metal-sulfur cluster biosynthetic enzyme
MNIRIDPTMTVRETMQKFPTTRHVFDRYGLMGCGGKDGPAEPLALFARVHQIELDQLCTELEAAVNGEPFSRPVFASQPENSPHGTRESDVTRLPHLFIRTALIALLTGGCLAGAVLLFLISYYGTFQMTEFWPAWGTYVQVHAHVQLSGWVALFIMGIAYFALPRFLAVTLPQSTAPQISFALMLAGIVLRTLYQPFSSERWAANLVAWGAAAEFVASVLFLRVLLGAIRQTTKATEPYTRYLQLATAWFVISQAILLVHAAAALVEGRPVLLSKGLDEAYLHTMLMGFIGLFILGVTLRTIPLMLDFPRKPSATLQYVVLLAWNGGILLFAGGRLLEWAGSPFADTWVLAGSAAELLAGCAFVVSLNPFQKPQASLPKETPAQWSWMVRAAYVWFTAAIVLQAVLTIVPMATGTELTSTYWGAFRHTLTVGWISMMIFGMAYRMIPVMEGRAVAMAWTAPVVFWLVNLGNIWRVGLQSLSHSVPSVLPWMAPSGALELTAGALFALSIWRTTAKPESIVNPADEPVGTKHHRGDLVIDPDTVVAAVLAAYPSSVDIFVRHGFTEMRNSVLRATAAKLVTIGQACSLHSVDLGALLKDLRALQTPPTLVQIASLKNNETDPARRSLEEKVWSVLQGFHDPEFPSMSVVDLGLIYEVSVPSPQEVTVRMTLTSRDCPAANAITGAIRKRVEYATSSRCQVQLVWDPPWNPDRIRAAGIHSGQSTRS